MAPCDLLPGNAPPRSAPTHTEVVEIPVLLPGWQALALEDAAHDRGLTAGEMLRHLLADFIKQRERHQRVNECNPYSSQVAWG